MKPSGIGNLPWPPQKCWSLPVPSGLYLKDHTTHSDACARHIALRPQGIKDAPFTYQRCPRIPGTVGSWGVVSGGKGHLCFKL